MTLLGLVELSHTPKRVAPGPWAQPALAENNVAVNTAVQTIRFLYRINSVPSNAAFNETTYRHRSSPKALGSFRWNDPRYGSSVHSLGLRHFPKTPSAYSMRCSAAMWQD